MHQFLVLHSLSMDQILGLCLPGVTEAQVSGLSYLAIQSSPKFLKLNPSPTIVLKILRNLKSKSE